MIKRPVRFGINSPLDFPDVFFLKADKNVELHWHCFYEIEFIIEGEGKHILNDKEYSIQKGMFQLITPHDTHEYQLKSPLVSYVIHFTLSSLPGNLVQAILSLENQESTSTVLTKEEFDNVTTLCALFYNNKNDPFYKEYSENITNLLLIILLSKISQNKTNLITFKPNNIINNIIPFLEENFKKNITCKEIAEMFYLSQSYFMRLFKSSVGVSLSDYLKRLRMAHAKKLITKTSLSVLDIAMECGYNSVTTFLRDFRKEFNCTPTQMRNEKKIK